MWYLAIMAQEIQAPVPSCGSSMQMIHFISSILALLAVAVINNLLGVAKGSLGSRRQLGHVLVCGEAFKGSFTGDYHLCGISSMFVKEAVKSSRLKPFTR